MAHNAFAGAFDKEDVMNWINVISVVEEQIAVILALSEVKGKNLNDGIVIDESLRQKVRYSVDTWFGLGVTKPVRKEVVDIGEANRILNKELARLQALGMPAISEDQRANIMKRIEGGNIHPAVLTLLVERVEKLQEEIKLAREKYAKKDKLSDMTAAPRALFDILSYISVEQLLTYIDEQNTHPNEHIGLMDIFGHDRQKYPLALCAHLDG